LLARSDILFLSFLLSVTYPQSRIRLPLPMKIESAALLGSLQYQVSAIRIPRPMVVIAKGIPIYRPATALDCSLMVPSLRGSDRVNEFRV
jgi:hypothetical protein